MKRQLRCSRPKSLPRRLSRNRQGSPKVRRRLISAFLRVPAYFKPNSRIGLQVIGISWDELEGRSDATRAINRIERIAMPINSVASFRLPVEFVPPGAGAP